jgi:hypothetical protein
MEEMLRTGNSPFNFSCLEQLRKSTKDNGHNSQNSSKLSKQGTSRQETERNEKRQRKFQDLSWELNI